MERPYDDTSWGTRLALILTGQHPVSIPNVANLDFRAALREGENFPVIAAFPRASGAVNVAALVLDADAVEASRTALILRGVGFQAVVEPTAARANRHMTRLGPPALLVVALEVPGAFDFLARVRSRPRLDDVAIVVYTRSTRPDEIERALRLRVDGYVVKSAEGAPLADAVRTVFGV